MAMVKYGVPFVSSESNLSLTIVAVEWYAKQYYIGLCDKGTWLNILSIVRF